jgi:hypothetical protein
MKKSENNNSLSLHINGIKMNIGICKHHASKLNNYFFVKKIILYNAQLNVSHIQKNCIKMTFFGIFYDYS